MKHTIRLLAALLLSIAMFAEDTVPEPTQNPEAIFRLFRTQNVYTLLKLDTRTGQIWQTQWGTEAAYRSVEVINPYPLAGC